MRVTHVERDSVGHDLGIEPGDVVLTVHRWPVRTLEWRNLLVSGASGSVRIEIRDGRRDRRVVRHAQFGRTNLPSPSASTGSRTTRPTPAR